MRRTLVLVTVTVLLAGCAAAEDALGRAGLDETLSDARSRVDELVAQGRELGQTFDWCAGAAELTRAVLAGDREAASAAADELLADAPEELTQDLRTVAEAAARTQVGDPREAFSEDVRDAARDIYAYAVDLCGLSGGDG